MKKRIIGLIGLMVLTANLFAGQVFYVTETGAGNKDGSSWANAYADVQTAIDAAESAGGGEVWIAKGTYKHGSAMTMKNNVAIYGGFAGTETSKDQRVAGNITILDGERKYRVFYNNYTGANPLTNSAKLDNVTIQNGHPYSNSEYNYGAGMYNNNASPEITNCTFANNSALDGGGMYNYGYNGTCSPTLTNCTFSGNSAKYFGGGMYNSASSPELTNCTFSGNSTSFDGGGMHNSASSPELTNCTFSGNSVSRYGGGIYNYESSPTLTNCILWGNTASSSGNEIYNSNSTCKPTIDTCIIEGGYSSNGIYTNIITSDPKLMTLGNYGGAVQTMAVASGSSAISAGKVIEGVTTDARGVVRSVTAPTIGAYEYVKVQTAFESWAEKTGLTGDNAKPTAIPHNDGITNLEKFAFGLSGNKAASYAENALFKQSYADGKACFQFPISKDAADSVNVKVMTSEDLVNWVEAQSSNIGESGDFNLMQTEQTVPEGGKLFFKLIVEEK